MSDDPLLHGCSQIGHNRLPGQQEGGWAVRECPECGKPFEPKVRNQLFCTAAHNADWNNRATVRGRKLTPLSMVARITRNGTRGSPEARAIGRRASNAHNQLIQEYRDEDKAAGRMSWAAYLILRVKYGLIDLP